MRITRISLLAAALALGTMASVLSAQERRRDGDPPREGREGGPILCVLPLAKAPEADVLSALEKVFGKELKISVDKDMKIVVLQGPETAVTGAVQGLRDSLDLSPPRDAGRREGEGGAASARSIDVVRLRKAKIETVVKLVKQHVSDKLEITERPNVPAVIIEGDAPLVNQAASLARQIDGQMMHPSVRKAISGAPGREGGDRDRD